MRLQLAPRWRRIHFAHPFCARMFRPTRKPPLVLLSLCFARSAPLGNRHRRHQQCCGGEVCDAEAVTDQVASRSRLPCDEIESAQAAFARTDRRGFTDGHRFLHRLPDQREHQVVAGLDGCAAVDRERADLRTRLITSKNFASRTATPTSSSNSRTTPSARDRAAGSSRIQRRFGEVGFESIDDRG